MNPDRKKLIATLLFSLFSAFPCLLVACALRFGPDRNSAIIPAYFCVGFCLIALALFFAFRARSFASFSVAAGSITLIACSAMFYLGVTAHRDFFTAVFQYVFLVPAIFLYYGLSVPDHALSRGTLRQMARVGYVISLCYLQWVMLMGYAISTRAEPRPVESLAYNVYNLLLVFTLFFLSRGIGVRYFHHVSIGPESFTVDGKDISPMLGEKKLRILMAFSRSSDGSLRCREVQSLLDPSSARNGCALCVGDTTKAASCRQYRTTYNYVLEIKKTLEFFEIGTILSPDNKRRVLTDGWKMSFLDGVRPHIRR